MLKIYHSQGARSLRVLWLCEEMGVPYQTAEASFFKPSDDFKAVNPLRTVPAMVDGDVRMIESVAMMIYIMAKHGPTNLEVKPHEPGYADYLQFLLFGEAGVAAYGNPLVATRFLAPEDQKQNWTAGYLKNAISSSASNSSGTSSAASRTSQRIASLPPTSPSPTLSPAPSSRASKKRFRRL
jgi:glutathione S-transferase